MGVAQFRGGRFGVPYLLESMVNADVILVGIIWCAIDWFTYFNMAATLLTKIVACFRQGNSLAGNQIKNEIFQSGPSRMSTQVSHPFFERP